MIFAIVKYFFVKQKNINVLNIWFEQDGAISQLLEEKFNGDVISRNSDFLH